MKPKDHNPADRCDTTYVDCLQKPKDPDAPVPASRYSRSDVRKLRNEWERKTRIEDRKNEQVVRDTLLEQAKRSKVKMDKDLEIERAFRDANQSMLSYVEAFR